MAERVRSALIGKKVDSQASTRLRAALALSTGAFGACAAFLGWPGQRTDHRHSLIAMITEQLQRCKQTDSSGRNKQKFIPVWVDAYLISRLFGATALQPLLLILDGAEENLAPHVRLLGEPKVSDHSQ